MPKKRTGRWVSTLIAGAGLLVLPLVGALLLRQRAESAPVTVPTSTERSVRVVAPGRTERETLTLPANLDAFQVTPLYARVSGYLLRWRADLGDVVKQGQELAEIDTPELDQELEQARANLSQGKAEVESAKADLALAEADLKQAAAEVTKAKAHQQYALSVQRRNDALHARHVISEQDRDESQRDYEARQAELEAAEAHRHTREAAITTARAKIASREAVVNSLEANVRRLERLQAFKTIRAPFDGVVTRRRAEVGTLVNAGSSGSAQELFCVAQSDRLRTRINVPQSMASSIQVGQEAQVSLVEYPGRTFTGKVARTARAIDPGLRTLAVELELANPEGLLLPGTFGQVVLPVRRAEAVATIPTNALLNRSDGIRVATIDSQSLVRLCRVRLGRDYGNSVEVLSGLEGGERVVVNPPDDLAEKEHVAVVK